MTPVELAAVVPALAGQPADLLERAGVDQAADALADGEPVRGVVLGDRLAPPRRCASALRTRSSSISGSQPMAAASFGRRSRLSSPTAHLSALEHRHDLALANGGLLLDAECFAPCPPSSAITGISIFIDSRIMIVSPASTVWPTSVDDLPHRAGHLGLRLDSAMTVFLWSC